MSDGDDGKGCGYGKPPKSGQFKPGKSGNPAGRPKKNKGQIGRAFVDGLTSIDQVILAEAQRPVRVREGDQVFEMTQQQAVMRAANAKAIKGSPMAQQTVVMENRRVQELELFRRKEVWDSWQAYVAQWRASAARAKSRGDPPPDGLPHPDDIEFTEDFGVRVRGPSNAEELKSYRAAEGFRDLFQALHVFASRYLSVHERSEQHFDMWMWSCIVWNGNLPASLRLTDDELGARSMALLAFGPAKLKKHIDALCGLVGWPLKFALTVARQHAKVDLRTVGLRRVAGILVRERGWSVAKMKERIWADSSYEHVTEECLDLLDVIGIHPPASWIARARAAILARTGTGEGLQKS